MPDDRCPCRRIGAATALRPRPWSSGRAGATGSMTVYVIVAARTAAGRWSGWRRELRVVSLSREGVMKLDILPSRTGGAAENMAIDFLLLQRYPAESAARFRHYEWRGPAFTFGYAQKVSAVRAA